MNYESARNAGIVNESMPVRIGEIEIQARLYNGEFGTRWITLNGGHVQVVHFGDWNREAGPDFKNATILFENGERKTGDIELDWEALDWERHGHATNPAYASVQLHFFVSPSSERSFARTVDHREISQVLLSIESSAGAPLSKVPEFVEISDAKVMIQEAANFRLRNKNAAYARAASLHGHGMALFHAIASGMGYKNNAVPFLLAAQRAGLKAAGAPTGEALLFGLAGFLEPRAFDEADEITRLYLKPLWDHWWTIRDSMARLVLPKSIWKFSGIRPSNHPHRRLGALSAVAARFDDLQNEIRAKGTEGFLAFFDKLSHPYWSHHWNLSVHALEKTMALVGGDRAGDLLVNAYLPSLPLDSARAVMQKLRGPYPSGRILRALDWLVGRDEPTLRRKIADHQGLIQLYADFGALSPLEAWARIRR